MTGRQGFEPRHREAGPFRPLSVGRPLSPARRLPPRLLASYDPSTCPAAFPFCAVRLRANIPDRRYPEELKTIGDHLRKRRLDLGLRQKDLGALVGAAKPTVDAWEHRGTRPKPDVLRRIVDLLGYEPEEATSPTFLVQKLSAVRRELRLARSQIAEILGLSYEALWAWETGRRRPRGRSVTVVRDFLAGYLRRRE